MIIVRIAAQKADMVNACTDEYHILPFIEAVLL